MKLIDRLKQAFTPTPIANPIISRRGFLTGLAGATGLTALTVITPSCAVLLHGASKLTTDDQKLLKDIKKYIISNYFDNSNEDLVDGLNKIPLYISDLGSYAIGIYGGSTGILIKKEIFDDYKKYRNIYSHSNDLNWISLHLTQILIHEMGHHIWDNYLPDGTKNEFKEKAIQSKAKLQKKKDNNIEIYPDLQYLFFDNYQNYKDKYSYSDNQYFGTEVFAIFCGNLAVELKDGFCLDMDELNDLIPFYKNILNDEGGCIK